MHAVGVPVLLGFVFFLRERNKKRQGKARKGKDLLLQGREQRESKGKEKQSKEIDSPPKAA